MLCAQVLLTLLTLHTCAFARLSVKWSRSGTSRPGPTHLVLGRQEVGVGKPRGDGVRGGGCGREERENVLRRGWGRVGRSALEPQAPGLEI